MTYPQNRPLSRSLTLPLIPFLLGLDVLQRVRFMQEHIRISLGNEAALMWFLDVVFIALLLGERHRIPLGLELHVGALHSVRRGLPSHQGILPSVAPAENVPVHAPGV